MNALAALGRSLPQVLSPAPLIAVARGADAIAVVGPALALLEDLLEHKRIMPTEYRTLRAAVLLALVPEDGEGGDA